MRKEYKIKSLLLEEKVGFAKQKSDEVVNLISTSSVSLRSTASPQRRSLFYIISIIKNIVNDKYRCEGLGVINLFEFLCKK
jgi:hypothetical protein